MSKRRTRSQKIIAKLKRELSKKQPNRVESAITYQEPEKEKIKAVKQKVIFESPKNTSLLIAPQLIKKDLIKTAFLSLFFFILIVFIKVFLRL